MMNISRSSVIGSPPAFLRRRVFQTLIRIAAQQDVRLYLVGGAVRDYLISRKAPENNADFLVLGDLRRFTDALAVELKSKTVVVNERFGTVLVPVRKIEYEFSPPKTALLRARQATDLPSDPLSRDLLLRDFTINAVALSLHPNKGEITDPGGGREDLERRLIRTPLPPRLTLQEDPLRILRAARFAAQLGFSLSPDLLRAMHEEREKVLETAVERRTAELLKLLMTPKPSVGFKLLYITGVLDVAFPPVARLAGLKQTGKRHHKDIFEHTMKVLDTVAETGGALETRLAALLHDIGKPATRRFDEKTGWSFHGHEVVGQRMVKALGKQWRLPNSLVEKVQKLVRLHMRPINLSDEGVTDSAVRRLGVQAGEDIDELIHLCRADVTSADPRRVKMYLENFEKVVKHLREVEEKDKLRAFQSPVRGDIIMAETGLEPGPLVGKLKRMIEEAILDGEIPNEYDAALAYLRKIKDSVLEEAGKRHA